MLLGMWYSELVMQEVHLIKQVPLPCSANDTSTLSLAGGLRATSVQYIWL